jgi:hypothetical protein
MSLYRQIVESLKKIPEEHILTVYFGADLCVLCGADFGGETKHRKNCPWAMANNLPRSSL